MIEKLRAHPLFREVPEDALATLAERLEERRLEEGEVLFREGEAGDAIYLLDEGEIAIRKGDKTLTVLHAGQMLGEMSLFEEDASRSADAVATTATRVHGIEIAKLKTFLLDHPQCGSRFLFAASRELSGRLRRTSEYLTTVFETGRIVGAGCSLDEMAQRLLDRLRADVREATSATLVLYNPFGEAFEIQARSGEDDFDIEQAEAVIADHAGQDVFQAIDGGAILGVALSDEAETFGYLMLAKAGELPFTPQQEVVVQAVGQQTALGIRSAQAREEDAARERLARRRLEHP